MRGTEQPDGFSASNCQSNMGCGGGQGGGEALGGVDLFSMRCKLNREEMYTVSALENGRSG